MLGNFNVTSMLYMIIPILLAMSVHEFAHGYVADTLGDPTARIQGRLTLDPLKHIDPFGFLMLLFAGIGWAKPVPFNPMNFKNRKKDTLLVALAGPASNFIMAFIFAFLLRISNSIQNITLFYICFYGITLNVGFGIFNLLPFPPLDGSKILASVLPDKIEAFFWKYEKFVYIGVLILFVTGLLSTIISPIITPIINLFLKIALG